MEVAGRLPFGDGYGSALASYMDADIGERKIDMTNHEAIDSLSNELIRVLEEEIGNQEIALSLRLSGRRVAADEITIRANLLTYKHALYIVKNYSRKWKSNNPED